MEFSEVKGKRGNKKEKGKEKGRERERERDYSEYSAIMQATSNLSLFLHELQSTNTMWSSSGTSLNLTYMAREASSLVQ